MILLWGGRWKTGCCVRRLKEEELLDWVDLDGMNTRVVMANRFSKGWWTHSGINGHYARCSDPGDGVGREGHSAHEESSGARAWALITS